MRKMIILIGLPGSGKSTLASQLVLQSGGTLIRINRDDLRNMFATTSRKSIAKPKSIFEKMVYEAKFNLLKSAFDNGFDVVLDDTHMNPKNVSDLHKFAKDYGDVTIEEHGINTSIDECIKRDQNRNGVAFVGEDVIRSFAKFRGYDKGHPILDKTTYYPKNENQGETVIKDDNLPAAIICDLDGTFAIIGDRSPYDASKCDIVDLPNFPVIETVKTFAKENKKIIFMSGRQNTYRNQTIRFIMKYCPNIQYELHMRGDTTTGDQLDNRKDSIVKLELFDKFVRDKYNVFFVLDDRQQVVDMWRNIGLTCFQVAKGDF